MLEFLFQPFNFLELFVLIFTRILGMMITAPIFRNANVPYTVKIGFTLLLTNILVNTVAMPVGISIDKPISFAFIMFKELFVGLIIGFSAYIVYSVFTMIGQFIDMQIGFSMVSMFDPLNQVQITVTANFYYYLFILIAILLNAHHFFIEAIVESFDIIAIGGLSYKESLTMDIVDYITRFFTLTLRFSAPIVFVTLITNVVLGVLARVVPSLNMFVIGFPLKIIFGLSVILIMLTAFSAMSDLLIDDSVRMIRNSLMNMSG